MTNTLSRRDLLGGAAGLAGAGFLSQSCGAPAGPQFQLSLFEADVTPPAKGHPLLIDRVSRSIVDPLYVKGFVLSGLDQPIVLASVDWCEIRNESYERWRSVLAEAAGTAKERVLVTCIHQHDAPYTDRGAQEVIEEHGLPQKICDVEFENRMIDRVAGALRDGLASPRRVTHLGLGQAKAEQLASNRSYVKEDGSVSWGRGSTTRDPAIRALPGGPIDPWVKTISFWDGENAVAALSCYATHPMSYYGDGDISADFVGMARARRQKDTPSTAQIYVSGCSGDVTVGKYNDGSQENRPIFADRLYQGMVGAWEATKKIPLDEIAFRSVPMRMEPRQTPGYTLEDFQQTIADPSSPSRRHWTASLGLSWRQRYDAGHAIDVPAIDFGPAQLVLMPAESFVEYQLKAQEMRPDSFVMVMGYGECAPGYIPTAANAAEGYDDHYSWIAFPECEATMLGALRAVLQADASEAPPA
jgi:hypothetical protein